MANYAPSTRARIADLITGMRVDTGSLSANLIFNHAGTAQNELYTVHGTILLMNLFLEVTTNLSAQATLLQFNATFSTPAATVEPISAASASVASLAAGHRLMWGGGIIATANTITTTPGITDYAEVTPIIIGSKDGLGTIGSLGSVATVATGAIFGSLFYVPLSDGAYVEAVA
jgi:hypothetical protein